MSVQNLNKMQKLALALHSWRVFTNHHITQQAIAARLAAMGEDSGSKTNIFYKGKQIPVFIVDFETVLYLASNRIEGPYSFTAYHKERGESIWRAWIENRKTPVQKLVTEPIVNGERVRGEDLKERKRARLLESKQRKAM